MIQLTSVPLPLTYKTAKLPMTAAAKLNIPLAEILSCRIVKRAVDARRKQDVHFVATLAVAVRGDERLIVQKAADPQITIAKEAAFAWRVSSAPMTRRPVVVGSGPAGLFAALTLAKAGAQPLLLERGEAVEQRREAVERFRRTGILRTDSNVQFGEGGAGTFSDGKLTTGIKDERCRAVLETFAQAAQGDAEDILWQAKPHIGTDRLCRILRHLRGQIRELGGEVRFGAQVVDLVVKENALQGLRVQTADGVEEIDCEQAIFAIGHSARDTMQMLYDRGVTAEQKAFAVGVRIEHPREMIDRSQYGRFAGHPALSAAEYKLSCRLPDGRGVYSFCMCPGGVVIAAASEEGGVTVNGMSEFARNAVNSNSALLCGVSGADLASAHPLSGIALQREMEQAAFRLGGGQYHAPVQLVGDFLAGRSGTALGAVQPSYQPGVTLSDLHGCLPPVVARSLEQALPIFGRQIKGFDRADAVMTGVESRSSSPVRYLRDAFGQSSIYGVVPCGEGAGYAGGIMSAAVDGIRCAEWVLSADRR